MSYCGWHPYIESALVLKLSTLLKALPDPTSTSNHGTLIWHDPDGEELYKVSCQTEFENSSGRLYLTDEKGTYSIALGTSPVHFGGRRWWMLCPLTYRRAIKLYRYEAIGKFCHRTAIRPLPTYASQRVSGIDRIQHRRWAIRRKLGDIGTLVDPLTKPKWMRWRTFRRYQQKDEILAEQENAVLLVRIGILGILG